MEDRMQIELPHHQPEYVVPVKSQASIQSLQWIEKYRPDTLGDVVAQDHVVQTLSKLLENGNMPHLLFYGPPGTGKTSVALAIAKELYASHWQEMVLNLNASDERGVSLVQEEIKTFCQTSGFMPGFKLVILDEAEQMTREAQAALRRMMEDYVHNARFCIITNYQSKLSDAIISRCTMFRFGPLQSAFIVDRLSAIAANEQLIIDPPAIAALARLGQGDMRSCLNLLQCTSMSFGKEITEENLYQCLGRPTPSDIQQVLEWLDEYDFATCCEALRQVCTIKGFSLQDILTDIHADLIQRKLPPEVQMELYPVLADIEERLSIGCSEKINIGALVGCFKRILKYK